jgi:putative sigma-54 modulation protein
MQLSVTFRHMEASEAIKEYAADKLQRIKKIFPDPIRAQVVVSTERHRHHVDINITLHNGLAIKGREVTEDMYAAIDLVVDKIERQIRKYKDKITTHRPAAGPEVLVHHEVMAPAREPAAEEEQEGPDQLKIIHSSKFFAKPMTPEEAIMQMNLLSNNFLVFTNADTRDVNVVYKRRDGNYGLIETGRSAEERR